MVLDPQWLVTAATKIICEFSIHDLEEHRTAQRTKPKSWSALTRSAELSLDLLPVLWHEHDEATRKQLLTLMVKFGLAVPKRDASFLVPALLTAAEGLRPCTRRRQPKTPTCRVLHFLAPRSA